MSTYVMSDLHGEAELFHKMLEKIQFSETDTLYILGDVIDRGPDGIVLLREITAAPNIILLLGNHEYMMMQYFAPEATETEIRRWNKNGNTPTRDAYLQLEPQTQGEILDMIAQLPTHLQLTVDSKDYYLVHGFPGENAHDEVWTRPAIDTANPIPDTILIIGHTPVLHMQCAKEDREDRIAEMIRNGEHPQILHAPGFINIDCGCSYDDPIKTLACLRLEDMKEFYVNQGFTATISQRTIVNENCPGA